MAVLHWNVNTSQMNGVLSPLCPDGVFSPRGYRCILNLTINSPSVSKGVEASAVRENHRKSQGRNSNWKDLASQGRKEESGWTARSVNLSGIQRRSDSAALQAECSQARSLVCRADTMAAFKTSVWCISSSDCLTVQNTNVMLQQ